jgi:predicted DCC family thiol-disulfide oxidoreductase YuxK
MVKQWMMGQPRYADFEFVAASSVAAFHRFPRYASAQPEELIVIDERGGVYRGDGAWIMCLWSLQEYRALSVRLASPALRPLARRMWAFISSNRRSVSAALALQSEKEIFRTLAGVQDPMRCANGAAGDGR